MPELPEVETVCRKLSQFLINQTFNEIHVLQPKLRYLLPTNFIEVLNNQRIISIKRRSKYIQIFLDNDYVLLVHLGMSGTFIIDNEGDQKAAKHDHIIFNFAEGAQLFYSDPRRFGFMTLVKKQHLKLSPFIKKLGPEPLTKALNLQYLSDQFYRRKKTIKSSLLDQKIIAGLGNIYANEVLFEAKISPLRQALSLDSKELIKLLSSINNVITKAIDAGGSTLRDYKCPDGKLGYFQHSFQVYNRASQWCYVCRKLISKCVQNGRSTFFCAHCQT